MPPTIAKLRAFSSRARTETERVGHEACEVEANTQQTFTLTRLEKDGRAWCSIERVVDGYRELLAEVSVSAEDGTLPHLTVHAIKGAAHHVLVPRYRVDDAPAGSHEASEGR